MKKGKHKELSKVFQLCWLSQPLPPAAIATKGITKAPNLPPEGMRKLFIQMEVSSMHQIAASKSNYQSMSP